jgi:ABC-type bacteriocin/lantibiotic exporter with double-glycine peptidase domain
LNNSKINGEVAASGICFQSTTYTCGAASLATFLNIYDIEATEIEMAKLTRTCPNMGANTLGIYYALRHKLENTSLDPRIKNISFEELKQFNKPSIITTKLTFLVDHVIVVLGYEDGKFNIIDPLSGKYFINEEELQEKWRGVVIYIE